MPEAQDERPILFGNPNSGHSYKVALMLRLAGIDFIYRRISLARDIPVAERPADFRAHARFDQVPALSWRGQSYCQSNAILLFLSSQTGVLRPKNNFHEIEVMEWLFWEASQIGINFPRLRYLYLADQDPPGVRKRERARTHADLTTLNTHLQDKAFLVGGAATVADIACAGYLFWLADAGVKVACWPAVAAWLDRIQVLPRWAHPSELL